MVTPNLATTPSSRQSDLHIEFMPGTPTYFLIPRTFSKSVNLPASRSKHANMAFHSATSPRASHPLTTRATSSLLTVKYGAPWSNRSSVPSSITSLR
ncbi:Os03g0784050, partial [Oryza sativa Japonica Group]